MDPAAVQNREPVFNVPGMVLGLTALMIAIHLGRQVMNEEDGLHALLALAFIPARYGGMAAELPGGMLAEFTSPVTHMLVHADVVHLAINSAWLLAFGSVIDKRIGGVRFLVFSIFGGLAGALLFYAIQPNLMAPVIGASGAVAAMMGAVIRFLFPALDRGEGYLLRQNPAAIPLMPLALALRDRRILLTTLVFVVINLLAIVGLGGFGTSAGAIAWEAHLGGYFFGLSCFGLFDIASQNAEAHPPDLQ